MAATGSDNVLYVVLLIHLILCIVLLSNLTPSGGSNISPLVVAGITVPSTVQWAFATFNALSIVSIIMAGVGNLYLIQSHLEVYLWLLVLSLATDISAIVVFLFWGSSCSTNHASSSHIADTVSCSFTTGGAILGLAVLFVFKVVALFMTSRARKTVRTKYSEELLPYLKMSFRSSFSEASAFGPEAYSAEFYEAAPAEASSRSLSFRGTAVPPAGGYGTTMVS
mmetsp:Transcript_35349/g.92407  ORF Transcript_35349/g.92407 Transcript_35349/m.92407 type:complete len:224 (+) Transcript_35349:132-803(+)